MIGRRSFLKILGGTAAAAVAAPIIAPQTALALPSSAPLFVPAANLDFGVPTGRLSLSTDVAAAAKQAIRDGARQAYADVESISMLLLQDNYIPWAGGKVKAGTEITVDRETADRWVKHGVAAAGMNAPRDLQMDSAKRLAERRERAEQRRLEEASWQSGSWDWDPENIQSTAVAPDTESVDLSMIPSGTPFDGMFRSLMRKGA